MPDVFIPEKTFIYSLNCPFSGNVRYIGKSNNPKKRLMGHIVEAKGKLNGNKKQRDAPTYKDHWINNILSKGRKPIISVIDEVRLIEWEFWEQHYISLFRSWGFNLTNLNSGGLGTYYVNAETRKKIGEANKTPERLQRLAELRKKVRESGVFQTEEFKKKSSDRFKKFREENPSYFHKLNLGIRRTEENKKNISEGKKEFYKHNEHHDNRPIHQYDLNWNLVKSHKNRQTLWDLGFNPSHASGCARLINKRKRHKGFFWTDPNVPIEKYKEHIQKNNYHVVPVYQYDFSWNLIKKYSKLSDVSIDGFNAAHVGNCVNGKRKTHAKHYWVKSIIETSDGKGR